MSDSLWPAVIEPGTPEAAAAVKARQDDHSPEAHGAALLDAVAGILGRYVAYPSPAALAAVTLWAAHTHALEAWDSTPRLDLLSPEAQSGKTRTLEVLDFLVVNPLSVANTTVAVLARTIDAAATTVLLDEADAIFGSRAQEHEDLRAILNAGHRRGADYARMVGEGTGMAVKRFATFAPVAIAGIGDLPETIMQRSVVIRMRRRAPGEHVGDFRFREAREECEPVRDAIAAWCAEHLEELAEARPVMPEGITDRPADVWEPLLAVADAAGGDWPVRARAACLELVKAARTTESGSLGVRLLADLRAVFGHHDRLHTETILDRLHDLEEAPWADLRGKPLDARGLAKRLRAYGVEPVQVKLESANRRGYRREDLHDAWTRYLPTPSGGSATSATGATAQVSESSAVAEQVEVADASATSGASATRAEPLTSGVAEVAQVADFPEGEPPSPATPEAECLFCGERLLLIEPGQDVHPACADLAGLSADSLQMSGVTP